MVSLSNHEAPPTVGRATPSWFDRLTMKAISTAKPHRVCSSGGSRVIRIAYGQETSFPRRGKVPERRKGDIATGTVLVEASPFRRWRATFPLRGKAYEGAHTQRHMR